MAADNGLMGDMLTGIDLPEAELDQESLVEEKKMAKYSKTKEFKRIQEHFEERTKFYQRYLPDGRPVVAVSAKELGEMWLAANVIIAEFQQVISLYENAKAAVDENG